MAATPTVNVLRLEPVLTKRSWEDGRYQRTLAHYFLDFTIDGRSLRELVDEPALVTPLSRPWLEEVPAAVERLLGRRETEGLAAGRVGLLLCGLDGDIACGAVTVRVQVSDGHVGWTDWLWESDQDALPVERQPGPLLFDRKAYEAQLSAAFGMVQEMPFDELSHRGKRFLWPWEWGWRMPGREK